MNSTGPKKKQQPDAAQQLIDSLLDDEKSGLHNISAPSAQTSHRFQSHENTNGESPEIAIDLKAHQTSSGHRISPLPEISDIMSVELDQDEKTLNLSLETGAGQQHLDPLAQAEKTVRYQRQQRLDQETKVAASHHHKSEFDLDQPAEAAVEAPQGFHSEPDQRTELKIEKKKSIFDELERLKAQASSKRDEVDRQGATEVRVGRVAPTPSPRPSGSGGMFSSSEAVLKQSENLRLAQGRITELEHELDRIRRENEGLVSAGETLRRRMDEIASRTENIESNSREAQRMFDEEKKVLRGQLQAKERENSEMRNRIEEMEGRLESNFKKIRVRERELEHRLEIVKMESTTLISTKDKMILELKRQLDQVHHENDYAKQKTQELFNQYKEKQETIRRVVRALRIALTILEGDEDNVVRMKKAE